MTLQLVCSSFVGKALVVERFTDSLLHLTLGLIESTFYLGLIHVSLPVVKKR